MANLYYTKDLKKIFADKVKESGEILINAKDLSDEQVIHHIHEVRIFMKYANEIIEELEEKDIEDDKRRAEWKAMNGSSTVTVEVNQDDN